MSDGAQKPVMIVNSTEWHDDFNASVYKVCQHLWGVVLDLSTKIENDKGEKVTINPGDLSNVMTQIAQAWRREKQAEADLG